MWLLDADSALNDPHDDSGFAAVRVLLASIGDRAERFAALYPHYRASILWTGDTGSGQGGFSMPADLVSAIGRLGCDFDGTVFNRLDEVED